jgi:hypothetical protein
MLARLFFTFLKFFLNGKTGMIVSIRRGFCRFIGSRRRCLEKN